MTHKNQYVFAVFFIALGSIIFTSSVFAQAAVALRVSKLEVINGDTCEIYIEGANIGDRQISMGIDFRINAKNGDLISTSALVFELRKGKTIVKSIYARNEKCIDVGSLSIQDVMTCQADGKYLSQTSLCERVIFPKPGLIPIKK